MVEIDSGTSSAIRVLASDGNGSPGASSVAITSPPSNGSVEVQSDGSVLFTPAKGEVGTEIFSYTINGDDNDPLNNALVTVSVTNAAPPDGSVAPAGTVTAAHRDGQTFLTWEETSTQDGYHVYRHDVPITALNLSQATKITSRWGALDNNTSVNKYRGLTDDIPDYFVIEDLGVALDDNTGLFVYTTQAGDSSSAYYAVTPVVDGVEVTVSPLISELAVSESVSQPRDILTVSVNEGKGRIYTQFMDYVQWNPTFNGYAYNYSVALPGSYDSSKAYPLLIEPHDYYSTLKFREQAEFNWEVIQLFPHDPGPSLGIGATHSWWYGYAADHNYLTDGPVPSTGHIENFTEQRVMRSVDELLLNSDFNVDDKLIHGFGGSMGASAVLSWGMRYPSVLSGVYASKPLTNFSTSPLFQEELTRIWGSQTDNLPIINTGPHSEDIQSYEVGVWDWMNHQQQLIERRADTFAYLMTSHGKQDTVTDWQTQGEPLVQAFSNANVGFSARYDDSSAFAWGNFDSVVSSLFGLGTSGDFSWRYPLDLSYPAIQNASGSAVLMPSTAGIDSYNLNIEWATDHTPFDTGIVDQTDRYEITLRSTASEQTADITPRRTQQFSVSASDTCAWSTTNRNDSQLIATGVVTADIDSLVTVTDVSIVTGIGSRLVIDCSGEPLVADEEPVADEAPQ